MEKENEQERIWDLLKTNPKGLTIEEVSKILSLSRATTAKYLNMLVIAGKVRYADSRPGKACSISPSGFR